MRVGVFEAWLVAAVMLSSPGWASEPASEPPPSAPPVAPAAVHHDEHPPATPAHHEEHAAGHDEEWKAHRHFLTAFAGATISMPFAHPAEAPAEAGPEAGFTAGLDYSFRVSKYFGVGVFVDYAFGPLHELLAGPCVFIYPVGGLYIELAPSVEYATTRKEVLLVGRLALGYEFEITPQFVVGPYIAADYWGTGIGFVPGATAAWGF